MNATTAIKKQLITISRSARNIERAARTLVPLLASLNGSLTKAPPAKRRLKLTPKRRAALKLQGQYLGHMRGLKPRQKAKVRAVREKRGVEAAVRVAKALAT